MRRQRRAVPVAHLRVSPTTRPVSDRIILKYYCPPRALAIRFQQYQSEALLSFRVSRFATMGASGGRGLLVVMRAQATPEDIARVCAKIETLGFKPHVMPGAERTAVGITGNH